jgi:hypothetical protein
MKDINLLPDDMKVKSGSKFNIDDLREKVDPKMILWGILIFLGSIVVFFLPILISSSMEKKLTAINSEIESPKFEPVRQVKKAIEDENIKIDTKKRVITDIENSNLSFSEMFTSISGILPTGCTISSFTYIDNTISIKGAVIEDIQIGEIITRAKRLKILELEDMEDITYDENKNFTLTFKTKGK